VTANLVSRHGADTESDLGTDFRTDIEPDTKTIGTGLDGLVHILDLEQIDNDIFRGRTANVKMQRIFGGQVAGQALVAAGRTVPADRTIHSLHSYFLRPGDPTVPIVFLVDRVRDGKSFSTRYVSAVQHGRPIFTLNASFHAVEPGFEHQDEMPDVPDPESLPPIGHWEDGFPGIKEAMSRFTMPIDLRYVDDPPWVQRAKGPRESGLNRVWMRANGILPNDPLIHVCTLAFSSDLTLLDSFLIRHGVAWGMDPIIGASLDHAMWFHRPFRADEWFLYVSQSPSASGGRGLARGQMYNRDGLRIASVVQEGLVRHIDPDA